MATWYIDPINGNDANAGTSFANRCKLFSALTAKGLAAGDTIRVIGCGPPVDTGVNAAFTNNSQTVTLASALNADVSTCETVWSGGTGVTYATTTSSKEGTNATQLIIGGTYVNGTIMGYKALAGSTDFSAYQQLCFWFKSTATAAAGDFIIRLCSDAAGATPVDSFNVPAINGANAWVRCTVNKGSALGSAIQSVSIVRNAGSGTPTITLDNIFTAKQAGTAGCLTLNHVIGTNTAESAPGAVKEWHTIASISGTTLKVGNATNLVGNQSYGKFTGATNASIRVYSLLPTQFPTAAAQASTYDSIGVTGTQASPITVQGGYNTSDMTSVDSDTMWMQPSEFGYLFSATASKSFITYSNMHWYGGYVAFGAQASGATNITYTNCGFGAATVGVYSNLGFQHQIIFNTCWFAGNTTHMQWFSSGVVVKSCRFGWSANDAIDHYGCFLLVDSCGFYGCAAAAFKSLSATNGGSSMNTVMRNCTTANCNPDIALAGGTTYLDNCVLGSATEVTVSLNIGDEGAGVFSTNHDQTANNHQQWVYGGKIISDTTTRHTASGIAWKFSPTSTNRNAAFPLKLKLASAYCVSGATVTVSAYFAKDHVSNISAGLFIPGSQLGGPASDTTVLTTVAGTSTYESTATSTNWTPTTSGVVEIYAIAYGGTTNNAWVDDITISQA